MHGARADGATLFLAPAANCPQVTDNVPEGLEAGLFRSVHPKDEVLAVAQCGHWQSPPLNKEEATVSGNGTL